MSPASGRVIPLTHGAGSVPGVLLALGYGLMMVAGVWGFLFESSTSASHVLGFSTAEIAWNFALIFGGFMGAFSRFTKAPRTEVIAVETVASVLILWGIFVLLSPLNDQSAILLFGVAFLMFGWASGTRRFLSRRTEILDGGDARKEE